MVAAVLTAQRTWESPHTVTGFLEGVCHLMVAHQTSSAVIL